MANATLGVASTGDRSAETARLASVPLLAGLERDQLQALAARLSHRTLAANQPLFFVGERGDAFYLVDAGQVAITAPGEGGQEIAIATLGPGAFFGEIALLDGGPRTATARATAAGATLLSLSADDFHQFLRDHPDAALRMMAVLVKRERETLERLRGIKNVNDVIAERQTPWQRASERIASMTATEAFVGANLLVCGLWIGWNIFRGDKAFDPPPFGFLGFAISIESLLVSLFVLISQSRQGDRDRVRADLDYQVNLKAHLEIVALQQKMDKVLATVAREEEKRH